MGKVHLSEILIEKLGDPENYIARFNRELDVNCKAL